MQHALGIDDAFAFADAVEPGDLDGYRTARLPAAHRVVRRTDLAYRLLTTTSGAGLAARNALLRTAGVLARTFA